MDAESSLPTCPNCESLAREFAAYKAQSEKRIAAMEATIAELTRRGSRQAAPFRKQDAPSGPGKTPGRKRGSRHGDHAHRAIPTTIDEVITVPLPACCPACQGSDIRATGTRVSYQTDIPQTVIVRQFDVQVGECHACQATVHGRHALQTSQAAGAAASQLGPHVHAALAIMNKELGLSHGKCRRLLMLLFPRLKLARSTVYRSMARTAARLEPAHEQLRTQAPLAIRVTPDESGWRVGGLPAWLHADVCEFLDPRQNSVIYEIADTRSARPILALLGEHWSGTLIRDGWSPYDKLTQARHQMCIQHIQRRCRAMIADAVGIAKRFPQEVLDLIDRVFAIRRAARGHRIGVWDRIASVATLGREWTTLVAKSFAWAPNHTLAKHLRSHPWLDWFRFAIDLNVPATNALAEQAIRPAVVNRKVWGGNRTWPGTNVQSILMTCIQTCKARLLEPFELLKTAICSNQIVLVPEGR